jgi:hypothetical protein
VTETEDDNDVTRPEVVPCIHDDDKSSEISFGNKSVQSPDKLQASSPKRPNLRKRDGKADLKEKHRIQMQHIKSQDQIDNIVPMRR